MANDSRIVITAGLQIPETVHNIQKELDEQVAPKLNLKIACNISDSNLSQLQSQLSKISEKLTLNVNTGNIQQSISQAVKAEPVKINVTAELNKSALQKQAKEIEQSLGLQYPRGQTEALRGELKALLADYQKAISTSSLADMESTMTKIAEHAATYMQEVKLTNEELKLQQDRAKEILREQQKLYITAEQYSALQRQAVQDGRTATQLLNSSLGVGRWSTDISKFDSRNIPYWSKYAEEINQINPLKDAVVNEGDIVQGLIDLNELLSKSTESTSQQLKRNGQDWQNWVDTVLNAVNMARGEGNIFSDSFIDLASDAGVSKVEDNAQKLAQAYSTVQAAKDLYQNDKSVKSVTADWTFDANKNVTGFTINVNKLNGEVERLKHSISETGDVEFLGGHASDRGVQKQTETIIKFVNDYTAKLNSLKATVGQDFAPNISATVGKDIEKTTVTFDSFEKKLAELLKGNGSMGQLRSEFTALDGAVKSLGANLRGSDTSLNQFTNAINNSRKFDNTLKALEIDYQNLNEKQRESKDLTSSLADAQKKVADLQNTQKTEGYTNKWVSQYREANIALTQLTADLKLAKKLEQQDTSSAARKQADALKEIRDAYQEITRLTNKINMPSVTGENKAELERQLAVQNDLVNKTILRAQQEGLINDEFRQQIQYYETIQQNNLLDIQSRQREAAATQAQVDAQKRIVENAKQTADALSKISAAYDKILQLNEKLLSGKLNEAEYKDTQKKIEQLEISAIKERQNLEAAGLYTEEIQKQISAIRNRQETLTQAKKDQLASAEAQRSEDEKATKALETYNKGLKTVHDAYTEIARLSKTVLSPNATDINKSYALADIAVQRELIASTQERLAAEDLIDKAFEQEVINGELLVQRVQQIAKSENASAQAKKDEADAERQYKQELQDVNRLINDNLSALEKFNNSTVAKNNASNPTVVSQTGLNADLINQLRGLQESLANDKSPENVARITAKMKELDNSLTSAKFNSEALDQSLRDSEAAAKLESGVKRLTNQMDVFANTNRRATESLRLMRDGQTTFAAKWQELSTAIRSGNLSAADLKRLSEEFRVFKGEADAAGMTVSRFFQSMQSQLRMVLQRWISLYAVIGYIRKMIDNVKELDAAMINLRRVTDETDAGYQRFLEDANELARQMKTTTSSLIEMSYQWSKLGYSIDDALELAKSSTIFMRVADVGQDQALSNLVTALKAFRIEAGQTMDVVDKLDKLNNEYAVSAAGLGDGLERTASAMAMTGNSLDETLALLTGAGEITQNLENTGNALRTISLRLQNMKGKLEELGEPVDDLMEVSKVQTQILNLTHNQVDIINQSTGEFRSTYQILQDIAEVWDSLNSQSRSSLLEIIAGKNRANIAAALIQSFQSGQTQSALKATQDAYGTAANEYEEMMKGVQAQFDAFKGAFQEFSSTFIESDFLKGFVKFGTKVINFLTVATDKVGSLVVILTPFLMYFGGRTKTNIFSAIINGLKGLVTAETGAITASGALTTALKVLGGAISGLAIGALVAGISYVADKLIVTSAETEESIREISSDIKDLAKSTEELEKSQTSIENISQSYSKVATTVTDVNERKSQLLELQNQLVDQFKDEANGIDFINGKYSEQIKKLQELSEEQRRQYEIENADKIARARRLANLRVDDVYKAQSSASENGYDRYSRNNDKTGERAMFTIRDVDERVAKIASDIEGAYASLQGTFDVKGIYLSGTLEDARNQLAQIIDNYSKLRDVDSETLNKLTQRYKELNDALNEIKEVTPYIEDLQYKGFFGGMFGGSADAINSAVEDVTMQPFYDKVEEAQEKLKQLASPDDLTIAEYDTLYHDVQNLERELYKMADGSEQNTQVVTDLFNAFKQGTSENGDSLEKFVEQFNTTLEESFKQVAEMVTGVQDAMSKLAEGKGLSHSEAWKLLKEDTDGYLQSIKLVNGEYFFSQEELIKFKDAKIKASMEDLKASNEQYVQERKNQLALLETQKEELKLALENLNVKAAQGAATRAELDAVTKARIAIAETEDSIKRYEGLWKRNNLLIEELNQNLGETRTLSLATETELNNAVKALENEVKAVDDTIDSLNNRKDVLESEKKKLQEQLDILNEQKKVIEEQQKSFQKAVTDYMKRYEDSLKSQLDSLKQQQDDIKNEYEERIKVLKDENEERDLAYKKEKALLDLNKAKQQQVRTYSSARGWEYGASKEKVVEAQKNLDDVLNEEQIKALEKERDEKIKPLEKQEKALDHQIKAYEEYVKQYDILTEEIENKDGELLAEQLLGSDWREKIEKKDEGLLRAYKQEYENFTVRLEQLTKVEIKNIEDGIKAKEEDIDKIGEEITAYNNYKTSVQDNLNNAKTALEDYKNNVSDYCNQMSDSFYHMQDSIHNNHNKIVGWFGAVAAAARSMRDEIGAGAVGGALMGLHLAGFADGGVANSTGLAMLHGTKQKGEVIFNAADSKKLYDLVHNTPSLIASVAKQAGQLTGANITNNNGSSTNSINVNIGQVVANNPREFTQNLDSHLDAYFRKKLTLSYTQ